MNSPDHWGKRYAGQTLFWSGLDTQDRFNENLRNKKTQQILEAESLNDPTAIIYQYNKQGYRSAEFDSRPCVLAVGGSAVEGIGVREEDTWACQLGQLLDIHVWNLGIGACAMDTCFRVIDHFLPVLKPQAVVVLKPPSGRFELLTLDGIVKVYGPHMIPEENQDIAKEWIAYDENMYVNDRKNTLAIAKLCDTMSAKLYAYDSGEIAMDGRARDLLHPGKQAHANFAKKAFDDIKRGQL